MRLAYGCLGGVDRENLCRSRMKDEVHRIGRQEMWKRESQAECATHTNVLRWEKLSFLE